MKRSLILLVAAGAWLASGALPADDKIYRSTDEDGTPVFTDDPPSDDAEPVDLAPLTTVPAQKVESGGDVTPSQGQSGSAARSGTSAGAYQGLRVVYPPADQAVRHNGGLVPVRVELLPEGRELAEGHRVEIVLDGEVRGAGASLQVSVSPVNRGPHTVRARLVDADGNTIMSSDPVDFFLLRKALGSQGGQQGGQ